MRPKASSREISSSMSPEFDGEKERGMKRALLGDWERAEITWEGGGERELRFGLERGTCATREGCKNEQELRKNKDTT